jgi:hypothetical protein
MQIDMNKEEKREYNKKYNKANKEKLDAISKKYYQDNKERLSAKSKSHNKQYREDNKDGYYTVYYLKEEHYAGMTNSLKARLAYHKSKYNRHIEDVEIIGKYKTKAEASRVEAALHSMGYNGRNPHYKQQTLKQVL